METLDCHNRIRFDQDALPVISTIVTGLHRSNGLMFENLAWSIRQAMEPEAPSVYAILAQAQLRVRQHDHGFQDNPVQDADLRMLDAAAGRKPAFKNMHWTTDSDGCLRATYPNGVTALVMPQGHQRHQRSCSFLLMVSPEGRRMHQAIRLTTTECMSECDRFVSSH